MDVPFVPRVTVPGEPTRNGHTPCQGCRESTIKDPPIGIREHLEDLRDSVATSNRASLNLLHQMEALRFAVVFAGILLASYLIYKMEAS